MAARGFGGLAVRELAREAGIVPTAFYRHFESVDQLAGELAAGSAEAFAALVDELVATPTDDPAADWPGTATAAGAAQPQTWSVLARGLVDTGHPQHRVLAAAVDTARRRLGITLGRLGMLARTSGEGVDVAADLVVVVLIRHLTAIADGRDPGATEADCAARLRVILAGAAAV